MTYRWAYYSWIDILQIDRYIEREIYHVKTIDRQMDGWKDEWKDGWMDGWMDGRMDGWMDGLMDEWIDVWMVERK